MAMDLSLTFCPRCGRLMLPSKEGDEVKLTCRICNFVTSVPRGSLNVKLKQSISHSPKDRAMVIEATPTKTMPTVKVSCSKCGNNEAYWWFLQTRRADEGSTRFYRCTNCGFTWREYD